MSNGTTHSILGLLSWYPMSGYELKSMIESSIGNFWSESFGQIYPELRRLEAQGLVTSEPEPGENPKAKRKYAITDAGREELRRWLAQPPRIRPPRNELLLKLFFARRSDPAAMLQHVVDHRTHAAKALDRLKQAEASMHSEHKDNPHMPFWVITIRNGIYQYDAILRWCDETIAQLETVPTRSALQAKSE